MNGYSGGGSRVPVCRLFQRQDFATIRISLEDGVLQLFEELQRDFGARFVVDDGDLKLHPRYLPELCYWCQQDDVRMFVAPQEPNSVFEAPHRLVVADINLFVLEW